MVGKNYFRRISELLCIHVRRTLKRRRIDRKNDRPILLKLFSHAPFNTKDVANLSADILCVERHMAFSQN